MQQTARVLSLPVLICTLGYFIDAYDLLLFSAVRAHSLSALGITGTAQLHAGISLINAQMFGLVVGGLFFGVLGDKFGRTKVLFFSIGLYSIATLANAFIATLQQYIVLRFIAGLGLAGELGLAITLTSELLDKRDRGYAAAMIAGFGMLGCVWAGFNALYLDWRTCYIIGGILGFILLFMRASMVESAIFQALDAHTERGNLWRLVSAECRRRFLLCILIATPIPLVFWLLIAFAPEFTRMLGLAVPLLTGEAVIYGYGGFAAGDLCACLFSQWLKSRRKALLIFLSSNFLLCLYFLAVPHGDNPVLFKLFYSALGFTAGYWALMALISAEIFGTNLRATVATSVPNIARAAAIPIGLALLVLREPLGLIGATLVISVVTFAIALWAAFRIEETYGKDLQYIESITP